MVLSLHPDIVIEDEGDRALLGGISIADNVLVTADGAAECLTDRTSSGSIWLTVDIVIGPSKLDSPALVAASDPQAAAERPQGAEMPEAAAWQFKDVRRVPDKRRRDERLVLKGRIFTGDDDVIEAGFVRVEDGRIGAVGREADLGSGAEGARVVGGAGSTIMPGLFNNHAHLAWDGANDLATQALEDSPEISAYKCAANMLRSLRAGVTTVRDLGMNRSGFAAKQAVAQGVFPGPKLLICGEAIVQTGGHTYWCCREASGPDEMRRAVREQVRDGADLIKIMGCHDTLEFTDEELDAVVDETHRNGLRITAHATFDACIRRMLEHGVDTIEHGGAMTDETIQLLVDRGTYIITTFAPARHAGGRGRGLGHAGVEGRRAPEGRQGHVALRRSRARARRRPDRLRHRRRQPGGAARRDRARARSWCDRRLPDIDAGAALDHVALGADERSRVGSREPP